ncbi:hypothetical protein F3Y22_tig00001120pilonHSYRG00124 [Hibiscus syriacus]|uniref:Uncharacterized protein n=1 Tax=Hibiscus syriacus TaxID=106335 RepID=A0A6A3D293_HIBSY|nr:hypothetical protein F3Y22_tig00001120pilonHSYRG00124 [Hibiscus syriacus]
MPSGRPCRSPCPPGDLPSLGCPRIPSHSSLSCPRIARSDALGLPWSDGLVGWPRMPSVLGRAWHMQSLVARREDMAT